MNLIGCYCWNPLIAVCRADKFRSMDAWINMENLTFNPVTALQRDKRRQAACCRMSVSQVECCLLRFFHSFCLCFFFFLPASLESNWWWQPLFSSHHPFIDPTAAAARLLSACHYPQVEGSEEGGCRSLYPLVSETTLAKPRMREAARSTRVKLAAGSSCSEDNLSSYSLFVSWIEKITDKKQLLVNWLADL